MVGLLLGKKFSGFFIMIFIVANISIAIYALSFADYFLSLIPGIPRNLLAIAILTIFFVLNLLGIKNAARIQNILVVILLASLSLFVIKGIPQIEPGYFTGPGFFTGGWKDFFMATIFTSYATSGAITIVNFSGECKNPTKDIPFATIVSTFIVTGLFALVGLVAAGVLPVDEVAFQPLTLVATAVLSKPLFIIFIAGGALIALSTTLNANFGAITKPVLQACVDGWFPKKLGTINDRFGTPHYLLIIFYIIGMIPIVTGFDIKSIASYALILMNITSLLTILGTLRLPKALPNGWNNSAFKVSDTTLKVICLSCAALVIFQNVLMMEGDLKGIIASAGLLLISFAYSTFRYQKGFVDMEISYEEF